MKAIYIFFLILAFSCGETYGERSTLDATLDAKIARLRAQHDKITKEIAQHKTRVAAWMFNQELSLDMKREQEKIVLLEDRLHFIIYALRCLEEQKEEIVEK